MIKVLVVDDEKDILEPLRLTFTSVGYETYTAATGEECLNIVKTVKPDIVFLDIILTDIDGIELLKRIKEFDKEIVVAMVSCKRDDETIAQAFKYGAVDYITKPFSRSQLRDIIAKNISLAKSPKYIDIDKPHFLVCDDDEAITATLAKCIQRFFFAETKLAFNGREAIELVKKQKFDFITMDIMMPGINGIDTVKEIKTIQPQATVIVVSAYNDPEVIAKSLKAGADHYLSKSTLFPNIKKELETIMAGKNKLFLKQP